VTDSSPRASAGAASTFIYSSGEGDHQDLFRVGQDGQRPVRLTDGPEKEFDGDLSPDGQAVVYRRNPTAGRDDADIWVMGIDGSRKRNLTNAPEQSNWSPVWTPDGRIAFASARERSLLQLWTMAADGSDLRKVADGWCEYADASPEGRQFVCSGPPVGGSSYELWIVDVTTATRRQLTFSRETDFGAAWSPDGQWIAFARDLGERWSLRVIRADGTDEREIAVEGVFPAWSPDGRLAWSGLGGINVANADGSARMTLPFAGDFISWGP